MANPMILTRRRYLAYGSNLCADQMAQRCPAARPAKRIALPNWRFIINADGWATLLPQPGAHAEGLIWHLTPACESALDEYEGVATNDYRKAEFTIGGAPALIYFATQQAPGFPQPRYLERVIAGAAAQGLPAPYLVELGSWASLVTPALLHRVMAQYRLTRTGIHGPAHWLRVLANGRALAALTPGANPALVELFALLHDSRRQDEDLDLGHGERAAAFAQTLADEGLLTLPAADLTLLATACAGHEHGQTSPNPSIGCCWDADRLELSRLNRRPKPALLSTQAALLPELQAEAWARGIQGQIPSTLAAHWALNPVELT